MVHMGLRQRTRYVETTRNSHKKIGESDALSLIVMVHTGLRQSTHSWNPRETFIRKLARVTPCLCSHGTQAEYPLRGTHEKLSLENLLLVNLRLSPLSAISLARRVSHDAWIMPIQPFWQRVFISSVKKKELIDLMPLTVAIAAKYVKACGDTQLLNTTRGRGGEGKRGRGEAMTLSFLLSQPVARDPLERAQLHPEPKFLYPRMAAEQAPADTQSSDPVDFT